MKFRHMKIGAVLLAFSWSARLSALQESASSRLPPATVKVEEALRVYAYSSALELSRAALNSQPRDYRMWTLQGMAHSGAKQLALAVIDYQHALKIQPEYLPALEGAAQLAYEQGSASAKPLLEHILRLRPADQTTHAMIAVLDYKAGDCAGAVPQFEQAQPLLRSRPPLVFAYGICLAKTDRVQDAVQAFQLLVDLAPDERPARYNLALLLWKSQKADAALSALRPLLQSDSAGGAALMLAADLLETRNDTPQATELLRRAILVNPTNNNAYLRFATLASNHASYQVGIDMMNAGLALMPEDAQLYLARGVLFAQLGNLDSAMNDFERADRLDPKLSLAGTAESIAENERHGVVKGVATFRQQVRRHPQNAFDHYLLAEVLAQSGAPKGSAAFQEGVQAAERALQLDPNLTTAHGVLAVMYLRSGQPERTIEECKAVLRVEPDNQEALYHLILALRNTNRSREIPPLTKRLLELRSAKDAEEAHKMRYELVDNLSGAAGSPLLGSGVGSPK